MRRLILPLFAATLILAQDLSFEVVSIERSTQDLVSLVQSGGSPMLIDDAQVRLVGLPVSFILQMAYKLPEDRISGPGWMTQERFDVRCALLDFSWSRRNEPLMCW